MVVGQVAEPADLVVGGAGPGGDVAALHGARLGRRVMLVDRDGADGVGGVCLRAGCIPSKALIEAADLAERVAGAGRFGIDATLDGIDMARFQTWKGEVIGRLTDGVRGLLKQAGVDIVAGELHLTAADRAVISTGDAPARFIQFRDIVLATGSRPIALADLPFDGEAILDSTAALDLAAVPETLAVVGAGYVGLEIGTALRKFGSRVTIIETEAAILPTMDRHLVRPVARRLEELGVEVAVGATAGSFADGALTVQDANGERRLPVEKVIVAVGRRPNTDDLGLDTVGIDADGQGLLRVAADRRLARHIAAIGDITPGPALAHKAMAEAIVAVDALSGKRAAFSPMAIPAVVFSDPEIATAGLTVAEAEAEGLDAEATTLPLAASGRAATLDRRNGFLQVVADQADGSIVGVHIVGPHASELIGEAVVAIELGASLEDLALSIHPHPTRGEQFAEAAHLALGHQIHVSLVSRR